MSIGVQKQQTAGNSQDNRPCVFISHRHQDLAIAHVLRTTIEDWTSGRIRVFQSSAAGAAPPTGGDLRESLHTELANACLVLLIYVVGDKSANWSIYECGVATDPATPETRIVVFQCGDESPPQFQNLVMVKINPHDIEKFTFDFHKRPNYFRRRKEALLPDVDKDLVKRRASQLYTSLNDAVTFESPSVTERWHRLTLAIGSAHVKEIGTHPYQQGQPLPEKTMELFKAECRVVADARGAMQHFGYSELMKQYSLWEIFERWKQRSFYAEFDWFSELCSQMREAIDTTPASDITVPMGSASVRNRWYLLALCSYRIVPEKRRWEFDVQLVRVPRKARYFKVCVPRTPKATKKSNKKSSTRKG